MQTSSKVAQLFLVPKDAQCSETYAKQFSDSFFLFNKIFIISFWDEIFLEKKISFAPISFKLRSAYISEDSKKTKKKNSIEFLWEIVFLDKFFIKNILKVILISSWTKFENFQANFFSTPGSPPGRLSIITGYLFWIRETLNKNFV